VKIVETEYDKSDQSEMGAIGLVIHLVGAESTKGLGEQMIRMSMWRTHGIREANADRMITLRLAVDCSPFTRAKENMKRKTSVTMFIMATNSHREN
jgi:hypothetical protein